MEHSVSIAGFSDILGVISVTVSILVVAIYLQRLKGPRKGEL